MKKINLILLLLIVFTAFACMSGVASAGWIGLEATYVGNTMVDLVWHPWHWDNYDVSKYVIHRDGNPVATITDPLFPFYRDTGLTKGVSYTYEIYVFNRTGRLVDHDTICVKTGDVHGRIIFDTTWTPSGGSYDLNGGKVWTPSGISSGVVEVDGATLFIEPGTTVNSGCLVIKDYKTLKGKLHAKGALFNNTPIVIGCDNNIIENCELLNVHILLYRYNGGWGGGCNNTMITDSIIYGGEISCNPGSNNNEISGNVFHNCSLEIPDNSRSFAIMNNTMIGEGIFIGGSGHVVINNSITGYAAGIGMTTHDTTISNNFITNTNFSISILNGSYNNIISNNTIKNNYWGISFVGEGRDGITFFEIYNNTILNNIIENNGLGISLGLSNDNLIYNNYFNNTINVYDNGNNTWNITKTPGTNIIGGPYLGGNYWSDYYGTDIDGDGLGDTLIPYNSRGHIANGGDYLPLTTGETPPPTVSKSEIHVHKKEYLSTYDTHIDHNKIYDFTPEWSANVWDVENLDNVTYTITTSKNVTYINNWERYQDGTENTFILPPTVEGENYTWVLPLKDRIGSNINFVLDSSQTIQDNPWVDIDVNTTKEDGYERVNVTFTPVVPLNWINLYVRGNQIIEVSAYPPEFEIEMLTSSYVKFDSGDINQGYVYNFSVLVDNPYEVELELYASFGWEVESPSNLITLPVAELGSVTVEADVPVIWEHKSTLPESVQSIAIEFEEEKGFDTEEGTYPSIMGTHEGEIKPSDNINVSKLYTYPCVGTGGHTESIKLYENDILIASGTWTGYQDDWHNITIIPSVTLLGGHTYNYTIVTGSYPQIIHATSKEVT